MAKVFFSRAVFAMVGRASLKSYSKFIKSFLFVFGFFFGLLIFK